MIRIDRLLVFVACLAGGLAWFHVAHGYSGDTHYYLRFATALEACFDWDEAHLIASAEYLVDKNRTTTAEKQPFQTQNKINWHAFGGIEDRFNELWERALSEQDPELQLVKLGQFLHFIADWESHFGYGVRMGHGADTVLGRDPDSLGANRMNNLRMIDQTINHMMEVCASRGRGRWQGDDVDVFRSNLYKELAGEPILDEMFSYNSRRWKSWGVKGKKGREIYAKNRLLIEEMIERRSKGVAGRGVPDDFAPGDADHGIPPPIGLRYDANGDLVEVYGVEFELTPGYEGDDLGEIAEDALEEAMEPDLVDDLGASTGQSDDSDLDANLELELLDADLEDDGWQVSVRVRNLGDGDAEGGELGLVVLNIVSEELLGRATRKVPAVPGRESIRMDVFVGSEGDPTRKILIGASLNADDLSADNNDVWFAPWREAIEAARGKKAAREPKSDLEVEVLGTPKMWVDETGEGAWMVVKALVAGGRSSRRLESLRLSLVRDETRTPVNVDDGRPVVWMSIPDLRRRVVPAETLAWFRFDDQVCDGIRKLPAPPETVELTLGGTEIRITTREYELTPRVRDALARKCSPDD
jgi:hypothetical protein